MWLDDDKQSNWKNSEVTTLFVENFLEPKLAQEAELSTSIKEDVEVETKEASISSGIEDELELFKGAFLRDINIAIKKLAAVAEQSDNQTVKYKIERAIMDLEAKKMGE